MLTVPSEAQFKVLLMAIDARGGKIWRGEHVTFTQLRGMERKGWVRTIGRGAACGGAVVTDAGRVMVARVLVGKIEAAEMASRRNRLFASLDAS